MLEQFLCIDSGPKKPVEPNVVFYFNPMSLSDTSGGGLTYTTDLTGVSTAATPTINDKPTMRLGTSTSKLDILFTNKQFNVYTDTFTIEWSNLVNPAMDSYYVNEMFLSFNGTVSQSLYCRFENTGQGTTWSTNMTNMSGWTKTVVNNSLHHYAMVIDKGKMSFYVDGVRKADNLTITINQTNLTKVNKMSFGWAAAALLASTGNRGAIRISDVARYTGASYTVVPF